MRKRILCFITALLVGAFFIPFAFADTAIDYDKDDVILLAKLISAEARGEKYEGQVAVGNVVINRLKDGRWGDSLHEVIYYEGQFATPRKTYSESCYDAALAALSSESVVPEFVLFFQRAKVNYFYAPWYCEIGKHNFYEANGD